MRGLARAAISMTVAVAAAVVGYGFTGSAHAEISPALGPGLVTVNVNIRYSHFSLQKLEVHDGTLVRFLIHNNDPIEHEFIVGDAQIQALHEHGTEHVHPPVPGEVTVPADQLGETFYRFDQPGRILFACHFPGHFAYGMWGWITVDNT
jgi:uncharacterized cupredoxin-like copper-binding protein